MKQIFRKRKAAATYLTERGFPTSPNTLAKLATIGGGPVFQKYGNHALYTDANLDAWAEAKLSAPRRSTSDVEAA